MKTDFTITPTRVVPLRVRETIRAIVVEFEAIAIDQGHLEPAQRRLTPWLWSLLRRLADLDERLSERGQ